MQARIPFSAIITAFSLVGVTQAAELGLREPMALAAHAIPLRLDASQNYRPFFLIKGEHGVPAHPTHDVWDFGDMTGRYLEGLIMARQMGIAAPDLSQAEERLARYLLSLIGKDGLVHKGPAGEVDHPFSQGSALYGLLAWYESTGDPAARKAMEGIIHGLLASAERSGDELRLPAAKLEQSSGSHLAGYMIWPVARFYELTGNEEALQLAEGLTRWAINDPVIASGTIAKPLSWEGHIHSWLDTLAGCMRTAGISKRLDRAAIAKRCQAVYDWTKRTNGSDFGWLATYPTGGSCETCAISSAIRLAIELSRAGHPEYLNDVERFVRNQVIEAQFRDLPALAREGVTPTPMLLGVFDSQSMPNTHLGTRGGEDVGNVEGCCLNGGMRAIYLAWQAAISERDNDVYVNLGLSCDGSWGQVVAHDPREGRVDVRLRYQARRLLVHVPDWALHEKVQVQIGDGEPATPMEWQGEYVVVTPPPGLQVSVFYPLRSTVQSARCGKKDFEITWRGNTVVNVGPPGERDKLYQRVTLLSETSTAPAPLSTQHSILSTIPDTYFLQDAAVAARCNILARLDAGRDWQPFFRIYPFAEPPYAAHEKWDDADMTGRYVEALILARRMTGLPMDPREQGLRQYLASLFDPQDGLAYTKPTDWGERRACLFSQSCAMLGLLAWLDESGSPQAKRLLDRHVEGLMKLAVQKDGYCYFPKYEWDGKAWLNDPKEHDAPAWYGGRCLLPLVEYWKRYPDPRVATFIEKLGRYCIEINPSVQADGSIKGNGWWGHLHGSMDMASGIVEYGRLAHKDDWIAWGKRMYNWIGRTHTSRYGYVSDAVGSPICETCAIASRFRLGLALYRAGAADPFGEIDRYARNQLLENQFKDLSFLKPLAPDTPAPKGGRNSYRDIDRYILGAFQCWGTANDLIGHDDVEGCGAGGGMQALYFAWRSAVEWKGDELWVHLPFNRRVAADSDGPAGGTASLLAEIWSHLPYEGRVDVVAHRPLKLRVRLPDGTRRESVRVIRGATERELAKAKFAAQLEGSGPASQKDATPWQSSPAGKRRTKTGGGEALAGQYLRISIDKAGERASILFDTPVRQTDEPAAGKTYQVTWKGSTVLKLEPPGEKMPLYAHREPFNANQAPRCAPRYP